MLRKIGLVFVIASLFLSMVVGNSSADWWRATHFSDGWYALRKVPLPQGYEKYWWIGGCDFAHVRKFMMLEMKILRWIGNTSLSALISYIVGWVVGGGSVAATATGALTEEAKKKAAEAAAREALKSAGGGAIFGNVANLFGYNLAELFVPYTIDDLNKKIEFLRSELGISDYYVFGKAYRPQRPEGQGGSVTLALGARMSLRMGSTRDYFGMGYPRELRVIAEHWPRVLRWKTPELDFGKLDSRVWERGITGELRPSTVQRVFAYEVVDGKKIPYTTEGKPSRLPVRLDTPKKGGKIVGKVRLRYLKKLGESGLREVHVCSPVNEGVWAKKLDDYAFAIVINRRTVSATPSKKELNVGEKLVVSVEVAGFHPAKATIRASDGKVYPWEDWADAILRGASLQGAGITETEMVHEHERTLLKATAKKPGKVKAVLQTRDGPVEWELATAEKKSSMELGFLTEDDCPPPPEPNLYLSEADVRHDAEVNYDCLECTYEMLFKGEKQRLIISMMFGSTHAGLFVFDSIEKAKEMFAEAKPKLREQMEEEKRKQREELGREPPVEVKWDESDPDALIVESIDSSMADRKFYMKTGWFRYENCLFLIGTHKDRDHAWVRRVFDKLKRDLEALVDRKGYEDRPPA